MKWPIAYVTQRFADGCVEVECPLCPDRHKHGGTGHKISHCSRPYDKNAPRGYMVVDEG